MKTNRPHIHYKLYLVFICYKIYFLWYSLTARFGKQWRIIRIVRQKTGNFINNVFRYGAILEPQVVLYAQFDMFSLQGQKWNKCGDEISVDEATVPQTTCTLHTDTIYCQKIYARQEI